MFVLLMLILQGETAPVVVQQSANWTSVAMALIAAIPSSIAAIAAGMALLQSRRNAEVAAGTDKKVDEVKKDGAVNGEKLVEIHTLTNSNLARLTHELEAANVKIAGFAATQVLSDKKIEKLETMLEKLAANVVPAASFTSPQEPQASGRDVRDQLDAIQKEQAIHTSAIEGVQHAATKVAVDLAKSHERADAEIGGESGQAADAAARLTPKEKQLLKNDKGDNVRDSD